METNVASLGQGPGLAWKRNTSSFPQGSLAELQEWMGGNTEPPWHGEVDFKQWNTIGWGINDDGILCIKPWNGDTGETGAAITSDDVPWNDQASKIRKVESIGTIVLNANSVGLFSYCSSLTDLTALENWNVSKVTNMKSMFSRCASLTDLTALERWDVSNVTTMGYMFFECSNLTNLTGLEDWRVYNVKDMSSMFYDCSGLTDLTALANWDVSNVTSMSFMFQSCYNLTDLTALANWNVSHVTDMDSMFSDCSSLTDLTALANWNVSNVTYMSGMFDGCSNLTDLTALASWDVSNVEIMDFMFQGCSSLQRIGIPSISNGGQKLVENAEGAALTTVLPSIVSEDGSMGPYTWDELFNEMTPNPDAFQDGTVWVKAEEAE